AMTNGSGEAVVTLTSGDVGSVTVLAKSGNNGADAGQSKAVNFTSDGQIADMIVVNNNANADGKEKNKVQVTVTHPDGSPLSGEQVNFTASNSAMPAGPYPVTTDTSGVAIFELASTTVGLSKVTATLSNLVSRDEYVNFKSIPPQPMQGDITVNGWTFGMAPLSGSKFPTTGFDGARFIMNPSNFEPGKTYNWTSNRSWLSVTDAGEVTFTGSPDSNSKTVTITATPQGVGAPLTYTFSVNYWYTNNGNTKLSWDGARDYCLSRGVSLQSLINLGATGSRELDTLTGEWGNLTAYSTSGFINGYYWSSNSSSTPGNHLAVPLTGGFPTGAFDSNPYGVVCVKAQ
ncbi:Ig-like domain-containing protein, partial [Aeromonas veronii]